jgi:DNA-binding MarR family transcriptional regulator
MADQQRDLAAALLEAFTAISAALPADLPASGATPEVTETQLAALHFLARHGTSEMRVLAVGVGVTSPTMTSTIKLLVKKGLVERDHDHEDWRKVLITASARGLAAEAAFMESRLRALGDALERLTAEQRAMLLVAMPALRALTVRAGA